MGQRHRPVLLAPPPRFSQEFRWRDSESPSELFYRPEAHVPLTTLRGTHVGTMQPGKFPKRLLRKRGLKPVRAEIGGKNLN